MKKRGFTLVEILLVIIIVGILAAIVIPRVARTAASARYDACAANISAINSQIELWHLNTGTWPTNDLSDIGISNTYFPNGIPGCPVNIAGNTTPAHSATYTLDSTRNRVVTTGHGAYTGQ